MIKINNWDGGDLKGVWHTSIKIDGVRMLRDSQGNPVSKNGKPLYNLGFVPQHITDCEVYFTDWETTVSLVRSHSKKDIPISAIYNLDPVDPRLVIGTLQNPTAEEIEELLYSVSDSGFEGLILKSNDRCIKVKNSYTEDVEVIGHTEGKGKYHGCIGALITPLGKVGTGLSLQDRSFDNFPVGTIIEVEYMEKTKSGKFRHPRFIRKRFDK